MGRKRDKIDLTDEEIDAKVESIGEETINTNLVLYYNNLQNFNKNQLTNMYLYAIQFCKIFKYEKGLKKLGKMYRNPIGYLIDRGLIRRRKDIYPVPLAVFEYVQFRDLHFPYVVNRVIPYGKKDLEYGELIEILSLIKIEIHSIVFNLCIQYKVQMKFPTPQMMIAEKPDELKL
jgi:hypothetical protein